MPIAGAGTHVRDAAEEEEPIGERGRADGGLQTAESVACPSGLAWLKAGLEEVRWRCEICLVRVVSGMWVTVTPSPSAPHQHRLPIPPTATRLAEPKPSSAVLVEWKPALPFAFPVDGVQHGAPVP